MRKTLVLLILSLCLFSCTSIGKKEQVKKEIVAMMNEKTGDNFYFIYGLDRERSIATDVKYRGMMYSDKLKENNILGGVEVALSSLDHYNINYMVNYYAMLMNSNKIGTLAQNKAKELFGKKTTLENDGGATEYMYNNIMGNLGNNLPFDDKSYFNATIVNVFVDDLDKLDITDFRKKTFELGKFLNEHMNIRTYLQVYVRDSKYLNDYKLVNYSIYEPFRQRKDIQDILKKLKKKEKISSEEEKTLVYSFRKTNLDYFNCHFKAFKFFLRDKKNFPLKLENSFYASETLNDEYKYNRILELRKPLSEQRVIE